MEQVLLRVYFVIQKMLFSSIEKDVFDAIIKQGKVLEKDKWGVKVVETTDNKIVKFFRLKRVYSSAFLFPYAWRFKKNAGQLKQLGLKTVDVESVRYCLLEQRHVLTYKKVEGHSIKEKMSDSDNNVDLIKQLVKFISELHAKGVFFRSLHLGNIIIDREGDMALIDISDLRVYSRPLSISQRIRNWKHFLKYDFENKVVLDYGWDAFFSSYIQHSYLSDKQAKQIDIALKK